MTQKKLIKYICIGSVALVLLFAGFITKTGWNSRIDIPSTDMVQLIEMELRSYDAGVSVASTSNQNDVNAILSELSRARKTSVAWYSAANDVPSAKEYLKVQIHEERESTVLYLYYDNNRYCVYAPYIGIYRINQQTGWNIHQLFIKLQPQTLPERQQ
jgi:hypothetical protein